MQNRQHNAYYLETFFCIWRNIVSHLTALFSKVMWEISLAIRKGRERAGLTQEELAELSRVSVRTVRNLESGQGNIGIKPLGQIAHVLGLVLTLKETL